MKNLIKVFLITSLAFLFVGCAATTNGPNGSPTINPQEVQQITTAVCIPLQSVMTSLSAPGMLDPAMQTDMALVTPLVTAVCTTGEIVKITDLQSFETQGIPALLSIVNAAPLNTRDKQIATLSIAVIQGVVAGIVAVNTVPSPAPVTNPKLVVSKGALTPFIVVPPSINVVDATDVPYKFIHATK